MLSRDSEDNPGTQIHGVLEMQQILGDQVSGIDSLHLARPKPLEPLSKAGWRATERHWLPDDSVEVFLGDSGLSWVASSRGGGAVRLRASPIQCARAASVRPVAPETAERGQPSNVLL